MPGLFDDDPRYRWRSDMDAPGGPSNAVGIMPRASGGGQHGLGQAEELREFQPDIVDHVARLFTNGEQGPAADITQGLIGSRGLGPTGMSVAGNFGLPQAARAGQNLAEGNYGSAAINAGDAALKAVLPSPGPAFTKFAFKPQAARDMHFYEPFIAKNGQEGAMEGMVNGARAHIQTAYMRNPNGYAGDVGAAEMARAVRSLKESFPTVDRLTAYRTSNKYGNAARDIDMSFTPEWKKRLSDLPPFLRP